MLSNISVAQKKKLTIIPWPLAVKQTEGSFILKNKVTVYCSFPKENKEPILQYFKNELKKNYNIDISFVAKEQAADITFNMQRMPTGGKPAYKLEVTNRGIIISSNFTEPAFHAIQTFFQLLPTNPTEKKEIPFVEIFDHARFEYRGMHLDVSRHFSPISFIKKYIDYLAYHKLNTFHWHLTDDQGWRIEIKKYPKLTSIGSKRNGTIIGRYPGTGSDNKPYGGFYTQEEIKEVVRYAKERFIDVIPEIEMPGHASAAIAAYPELSCFPEKPTEIPANMISKKSVEEQKNGRIKLVQETWGVFDDVFCAGKEETFTFLQHVIDEVMPLFPSTYFHIGGDECPKTHWKICPNCQQRMKENNLKDEHELQSWFVQRIEKYLNSKNKILIGWDEILEGGLAPNAVVMSWRGEAGGIEAAKQKHKVIMTPGNPLYFDHTQSENEDSVTIGGYNPIEKVYAYDPIPKELTVEEGKYILGAQANLWREYITNEKKTEYMIFPRMAALSEVLWTKKENKSWESFEKRLQEQFKRYDLWKMNYSNAYYDLKATVIPTNDYNGVQWKLESKYSRKNYEYSSIVTREEFVYTRDTVVYDTAMRYDEKIVSKVTSYVVTKNEKKAGEKGIKQSPHYNNNDTLSIIKINESKNVSAWQTLHHVKGRAIEQQFHFNKATGKKIILANQPSKNYHGDGAFTLVNGVQNEKGTAKSKEFLGFSGDDCIATIDLGKEENISLVKVHYLHQTGSWIYKPSAVMIFISPNGIDFTPVPLSNPTIANNEAVCQFIKPLNARFVKIQVANFGVITAGNPGEGNKAWLFMDEIEIN